MFWNNYFGFHTQMEGSSFDGSTSWWSKVWSLNVPPKVKIFMWKISRDFLATEGNLNLHHVPIGANCFFCDFPFASTKHSLLEVS